MDALMKMIEDINGILWHSSVLIILLGVGVLFTLWTLFGQYRAVTHGVQVVRGVYDKSTYLEQRKVMMQWYADYLDRLAVSNVTTLKRA